MSVQCFVVSIICWHIIKSFAAAYVGERQLQELHVEVEKNGFL